MQILNTLKPDILGRLKRIKLLIMDVDGVLTDGKIYYGNDGELAKAFYVRDGMGIRNLMRHQVATAVISGRASQLTAIRLKELGVNHIYLGIEDKVACFEQLKRQLQIANEEVAYIGDDLPDFAMIQLAGLGVAVADAASEVLQVARYVTHAAGGQGAVRELCDLIIAAQTPACE